MIKMPKIFEKIALERMYRLIELAEDNLKENPERSREYIELLKKVSTKNRVRIPLEIKLQFCKKCNTYWKDGKTVKKRIKNKSLECTCISCGYKKSFRIQNPGNSGNSFF